MDPIRIVKTEEVENGWRFTIEVGSHEETKIGFAVTLDKDYWKELTLEKFPPERLITESFRYLLIKEPRTSIARDFTSTFNLRDIKGLYYSYERRMRMALFGTEHVVE